MKVKKLHKWDVSFEEAVKIQNSLKKKLAFPPLKKEASLIAGADVSFSKKSPLLFAAIVVMRIPEMEVVEMVGIGQEVKFPYIPGLLAFRELPLLASAFEMLLNTPDAVIADAHGIAHPRGAGLASHLGLLLGLPTVGCAKNLLVGKHGRVGKKRWSESSLIIDGKESGKAVRTRENVKPVFVSPGNGIDITGSVEIIRRCTARYRLPEPARLAHKEANKLRIEGMKKP